MTLDIEGVLAGHEGWDYGGPGVVECEGCGWKSERLGPEWNSRRGDRHRAHVAAVLREQIAAWLTAEGKREMHERGGHWHTVTASDVHVARKLDALAAQVAPSRVPEEGS